LVGFVVEVFFAFVRDGLIDHVLTRSPRGRMTNLATVAIRTAMIV